MAQIIFDHTDFTQGVQLTEHDKARVNAALWDKRKAGISVRQIADDLGVARPYLYRLLAGNFIEFKRFIQIQEYFELQLLTEDEVESYLTFLRQQLLPPGSPSSNQA